MVPPQTDNVTKAAAHYQLFNNGSRRGATINIVSEIDFNCARNGMGNEVSVNAQEHVIKEIGATMDVADRINTYPWMNRRMARSCHRNAT